MTLKPDRCPRCGSVSDEARSDVTPRTFVRAAGLANLLVATMVFLEFSGFALVKHDPKAFQMGLWLLPFVTLVVWGTATVFCLVALAPRGLRALGRRLAGRPQSSLSAKAGVWDDWLDRPEPHDR